MIKIIIIAIILFFSTAFFITKDIEKVVVPNHIQLREDKYKVLLERPVDSAYKEVYYKSK